MHIAPRRTEPQQLLPGEQGRNSNGAICEFYREEAARRSDFVLDQHENVRNCICFVELEGARDSKTAEKALELAKAFGLTITRVGRSDENMSSVYSTRGVLSLPTLAMSQGIPAFLVEYEGATDVRFNERDDRGIRVALRGLGNVLKKLGMVEGSVEVQTDVDVLKGRYVAWGMNVCSRGGLVRRLVRAGVKMSKGTPVANIYDPFGNILETLEMPVGGYIWAWNLGCPPWWNWSVSSGDPIAFIFEDEKSKFTETSFPPSKFLFARHYVSDQ